MSSHKSDGGRIPRLRDVASKPRYVSSPVITTSAKPSGSLPSRAQIGRPMPGSARTSGVSFSEAEENQTGVPSKPSRIPSSHGLRSLMPPRATTHPVPSSSRPTPLPTMSADRHLSQTSYTPSPCLPSPSQQNPVRSRPKNVLRRRAPTIGQHAASHKSDMENARPERLNVIIPDRAVPGSVPDFPPQTLGSSPEVHRPIHTPCNSQDTNSAKSPETQLYHGPKEFASLRTTVNTQNLPPPTPGFASASSPSTRYSGSPGVWSRTSTPTTLSSYSPGIVQPVKAGSRLRQPSPSQTRLPVFSHQLRQSPSPGGSMNLKGIRSPDLFQWRESAISLIPADERKEYSKPNITARAPSTPVPPYRRTSANSSLPRRSIANSEEDLDKVERRSVKSGDTGQKNPSGLSVNTVQVPTRPSREGTHRLELEPSPVVQSNLSPESMIGHKRRGSTESSNTVDRFPLSMAHSAATSVDSLHSTASSRIPLRLPSSPEVLRKAPETRSKATKTQESPESPAKTRRFGLFGKKSKPDLNSNASDEARPVRKGPAAGTGHEGYGRYGQRGRRPSVGSNSGTRTRSTSTTRSVTKSTASSKGSAKSRSDLGLDDFLLHRLEPVFINGGGMDGASLTRTQSEQSSSGLSKASTSNIAQSSKLSQSTGHSTDSLATSTGTVEPREPMQGARPQAGRPRPAYRVASNTSSVGEFEKPSRANAAEESSTAKNSYNQREATARDSPRKSEPPKKQEKSPKKGLGLKWKFFQRNHDNEANREPEPEPATPAPQLRATISSVAARRPVAHYAYVDGDSDPLEEIIHNVEESPPTEDEFSSPVEVPAALKIRKSSPSLLLPSPPKLQGEFARDRPSSPKVYFTKGPLAPSPETAEKRPSRLASIGRIPRVVSTRERQHKPALQSFSRPFSTAESPSFVAPVVDKPVEFSPPRPLEPRTDNFPAKPNFGFDLTQPFGDPSKGSILDFIAGPYSLSEFLAFSPRQDSMVSTSSDSDRLAAVTAVIPKPESQLTEDEVWGEYDDFIDHVLSPETTESPNEAEAEEGKLEMATMASRALQAELSAPPDVDNPTVSLTPASPQSSNASVHLRRSRIVSALHSSIGLFSQPSYSDIIASYGDDPSDGNVEDNQDHAPVGPVEQQSSFLSSPSLNPSPSFEECRQRNTILFDIAERDREGPTAQTNIRSGSLMTSRWLSFGRVLFSPAHKHIKDGTEERILVVDGLGNDDWSFYCALTYPKAGVYHLNDGPAPTASKHPAAWKPPSNHHIIHHASLEDRFPFPKGFFTVTVLRFPAASAERVQNNIVSECKRVLRPGGYMEMSVLDLDMVNMGIRTRKAVRQLKERTFLSDSNISLKPASDSIQRLLGRHGFDNLRRCMVRIPTAGVIVRSSGSSSSTSSSDPSFTPAATPLTVFSGPSSSSVGAQSKVHGKSPSNDTDLSLGDLLSDPSPSPSNDESIRKIVAKVGRWWYTRCYEIPVLPNGDADLSIWADRRVLRECQKRGTGFRLLIAYAQKPSEKRRTASV